MLKYEELLNDQGSTPVTVEEAHQQIGVFYATLRAYFDAKNRVDQMLFECDWDLDGQLLDDTDVSRLNAIDNEKDDILEKAWNTLTRSGTQEKVKRVVDSLDTL